MKRYLALGAILVALCGLFAFNDSRAALAAKAKNAAARNGWSGENGTEDGPAKPTKTGPRGVVKAPVEDKEIEKFRRFFLPPIVLKDASVGEAMAKIVAVYRETAEATGEPAQDLQINVSSARTRSPINCITPRAPAGSVIRYVAALAGNRTKGGLPDFRLEALGDQPDQSGKMEVSPDMKALLADYLENRGKKAKEARLPEDPFAPPVDSSADPFAGPSADASNDPFAPESEQKRDPRSLKDLLAELGFNSSVECKMSPGAVFSYENMSEAELELFTALVKPDGDLGPVLMKGSSKIILVDDAVASRLTSGMGMTDAEVQLQMREFAMTKGTELMTLPAVTSRCGQASTVEIVKSAAQPDGSEGWTGVKMASSSVPYGLGTQVEFAFESREEGKPPTTARESLTLAEDGTGVAISPGTNGKTTIVMHGNTLIDATGRPIAGPR